jgi:hypothetical protein
VRVYGRVGVSASEAARGDHRIDSWPWINAPA